jgi:hypothetical protein
MPPEVTYVLALAGVCRDRLHQRIQAHSGRDAGLTTLEVVIIAGGLALLAAGVVTAITTAVNNRKISIK